METFAGRMALMSLCFLLLHDARSPCIYPKNSIAIADSRPIANNLPKNILQSGLIR